MTGQQRPAGAARHSSEQRICLQIFTRPPVPGLVKTRLIPLLGAKQAAALHHRLTTRVLESTAALPVAARELWLDGDLAHPWVSNVCAKFALSLHRQSGDDLGARMANAAALAIGQGLTPVIIGTDCWLLDAPYLSAAIAALNDGADLVLGAAEDGGYVLIGLRAAAPLLFADMQWSTDGVLTETLRRAATLALRVQVLPTVWDVDRPEDVARLHRLGVTW